jgi:hypothetical protein
MHLVLALSAGGTDHNKYTCAFLLPLALMPPSFTTELRSGNCHEYSFIYAELHYLEAKNNVPWLDIVITYTYLANGNSFHSLQHEYLLGVTTIREIVRYTREAIWGSLRAVFVTGKRERLAMISKRIL